MGKGGFFLEVVLFLVAHVTNTASWNPILGMENERLTPSRDLKEVQIVPLSHHATNIDTSLSK